MSSTWAADPERVCNRCVQANQYGKAISACTQRTVTMQQLWVTATEQRLSREADCLGELLEQLRARVSPVLVGAGEWDMLLQRVGAYPVTLAAFPFGFEVPLHERRPGADFGVSLVGGSRTAELFKQAGRAAAAGSIEAGIAGFLEETDREESALRRVVGRKLLLEHDVVSAPPGAAPAPGIFLYPDAQTPVDRRQDEIGSALDALDSITGRNVDQSERRQVQRLCRTLTPDICIGAVGTFPARTRILRLAFTGFQSGHAVVRFLERAGWPGAGTLVTTLAPLEARNAFVNLGVHLDVRAAGVGPAVGLSLYAREQQWLQGGRHWTALIEALREAGLALPEKLSALHDLAPEPEILAGKSGTYAIVQGIHHLKITLTGDQVGPVKGYIFLLLLCWPPETDFT